MTGSLTVALAIRAAVVLVTLLVARRTGLARRLSFLGSAAASTVTALAAVQVLRTGSTVHQTLFVQRASGWSLGYRIDPLSAWFLLVLSVLAIPIALYSVGYARHGRVGSRSPFMGTAFTVLIGAVELVFSAVDAITFLFAWELMTLTNAALVATEHEDRSSRRAAFLYLVMSHVATGCLIAGFLVAASTTGTISFDTLFSGALAAAPARDILFVLFFIGFAVKAGIIPLHVWLPEAHPAAPSNISALMSAVIIKTGIYGIVRICAFGLGTPRLSWGVFVVVLGGVSAVLGVLYALMQHDLKRLLAYHSIENIGIILLGLGAGMMALTAGRSDIAAIGVAASLYHVLNHAVFKGLLFLGAGGVVASCGTRQIEHFGGLLRLMPWTASFFLVGALAISGLPPLNGFASEWLTFQAFLFGFANSGDPLVHFLFPVGGAVLALTTALAAACFVKAFGISFLALPRSTNADQARESPAGMLVPQAMLAAMCIVLGLFPGRVLRVLETVMPSLPGLHPEPALAPRAIAMATGLAFDRVTPIFLAGALAAGAVLAILLTHRPRVATRRVPAWGCGGELTAANEYTATAFSKPVMMIFGALYRPTRTVQALTEVSPYFPREVMYRSTIEPTFERYVYRPLLRVVLRVAQGMKVVQAGSLHAYLAYVIALVVTLVLFVWWTS
ncbi:MAG TPA: proton-conducting transporter membrane subunit [Vicinamibacterales bacterium]|nr:proton-conducting transporter membrane subunit [Vicinamibacterales bacterium]